MKSFGQPGILWGFKVSMLSVNSGVDPAFSERGRSGFIQTVPCGFSNLCIVLIFIGR